MSSSHTSGLEERPDVIKIAWFVAAMAIILTLGVVVRAGYLAGPMRYDESYNYLNYVARGPVYIATHYVPNNHILHTLGVWAVTRFAGDAPAILRLPALVAGILLIPALAWLAWSLTRRLSVALLSSLAVCCSSPLIEYSVNARGYSLLSLSAVLDCLALLRALRRPQQLRWWVTWGMLAAAGMYTIPIMVLPLAGMVTGALIATLQQQKDQRASRLRGLIHGLLTCTGLTLLAYGPIVVCGGLAPFTKSQEMAYEILGQQISTSGQMLASMVGLWTQHMPVVLLLLLAMGCIGFVVCALRATAEVRWLVPATVLLPLLLATLLGAPLPARTWLFALPFLFTMAAIGLDSLLAQRAGAAAFLLRTSLKGTMSLTCLGCLLAVWRAGVLCSEPGGLVLAEPALEECRLFGPSRCVLVAPYSPASAYYQAHLHVQPVAHAALPGVERVFILANEHQSLEQLWHAGADGFDFFERPRLVWSRPGGALYMADRVERNALR